MDRRKVAVVTGASSGIGLTTAKALAAEGWQVLGVGRDQARSAVALREIQSASSGGAVQMIVADLSLMADALRAAEEVAYVDRLWSESEALIAKAGVLRSPPRSSGLS